MRNILKYNEHVEIIDFFRGEYLFLSNFYEDKKYPVHFMGLVFSSAEAAFQSAKSEFLDIRKEFCRLNAKDAKKYGRKIKLRPGWEDVKDSMMKQVIRNKFIPYPTLSKKLVDTYPSLLIEGNNWHDNHFGSCYCHKCIDISKENVLGKLLTELRYELLQMEVYNE